MPRELNIEKLERKFTSLTKSRESIQAVASWIMHHHEFCEEIVEQWYIALTKDHNALVMFFVANEVVQNCGKKRVPQYREAFSKVLEKAVCLEKVKEIKADVCRIFNLWKERNIFDDDFFQRLEANLNETVISSPSTEEDEVSEMEIITKYKSRNLFDSLRRLKVTEAEAKEKEDMLNFADEPVLPELDNLTARDECLEVFKNINSFQRRVEECLKATNDEIKVRKNALKELKHSCIFYTAQYGDVKKVANAYMTYGKRLKNMIKKLSEKRLVLPSPVENSSPYFSESNTHSSPIMNISLFDHDTSSNRTSIKISPGSSSEKNEDTILSSDNFKNTAFFSKISKDASDFPKNFENKLEETGSKLFEQSPKQKFSKLAELFAETKSDSAKFARSEPVLIGASNLKSLNRPNEQKQDLNDLQIAADQQIQMPKNTEFNSADKSSNQETGISNHITKKTLNKKEKTVSSENDSEIDFLLEESYDTKKIKSNINVKRKIELLLQSQGKKICKDASKGKNSDSILSPNSVEGKNFSEDTMEDNSKLNKVDICPSKITVPVLSSSFEKVEKTPNIISSLANLIPGVEKNLSLHDKIQNVSNIVVPSTDNIKKCKEIDLLNDRSEDSLSNNNKTSKEDDSRNNLNTILQSNLQSSKVSKNDHFSLQTPSTFFDSSLLSSLSSISSEFLKNILEKNKSISSQKVDDNHATYISSSVKDFLETRKLQENEDFENMVKTPTFIPIEKEFMPTHIMSKPLSEKESIGNDVKDLINIKKSSQTNIAYLDNMSVEYKDSEQPNISKQEFQLFDTKLVKLSDNDKINSSTSDVQLKSKDNLETEKADDKPNLLLTLQNILECISNKSIIFSNSENVSETSPVSFENCLNIYHALRSDTEYANDCSLSTQNIVLPKTALESTISEDVYNQDNLEVMDMDCDSE